MLDEYFEVVGIGDEGKLDENGRHGGFAQDGKVRAFFDTSVDGVQGCYNLVLDTAGEDFTAAAGGVDECFGAVRSFVGKGVAVDGDEDVIMVEVCGGGYVGAGRIFAC